MDYDRKELHQEAISRRLRIVKTRAEVAGKALGMYYGYGDQSLMVAVVDLLVDAQHLAKLAARDGPTYDDKFTVEEAAAVAAEIYRSECVASIQIAEEPEVPPESPQESG